MGRPRKENNMSEDTLTNEQATPAEPAELAGSTTQPTGVVVAIDEEADKRDTHGGDCINCNNHGITTELQTDGKCAACGFDKTKLYGAF